MNITWLGTAGFRIKMNGSAFLIDPYLTRNPAARPKLDLTLDELSHNVNEIFLSHGHFDHTYDIPRIASRTGAIVYCSKGTAKSLENRGVPKPQLKICRDLDNVNLETYRARCFYSSHFIPDGNTIRKALPRVSELLKTAPLALGYPMGQVLAWLFTTNHQDPFSLLHFGSSGFPERTISRLQKQGKLNLLLLPMVGRSDHSHTAVEIIRRLQPEVVIPHHHDNFYPPISLLVSADIPRFAASLQSSTPAVEVYELQVGETITL